MRTFWLDFYAKDRTDDQGWRGTVIINAHNEHQAHFHAIKLGCLPSEDHDCTVGELTDAADLIPSKFKAVLLTRDTIHELTNILEKLVISKGTETFRRQ